MFKSPNEIQMVDNGIIMPWYTFPCLEYLKKHDYSNWDVFEWGGGCSTVWYSFNCKSVDTLEADQIWASEISKYLLDHNKDNWSLEVIEVPAEPEISHVDKQKYLEYIRTRDKQYDVIVIDGSYRNDCIPASVPYVKSGGLLIFDNFEQIGGNGFPHGYETLSNKYLLKDYQCYVFEQPGRDYWKTAVWILE